MSAELSSVGAIRFGSFELDLRTREVRKGGLRLKLETKPFQVLELLVQNADRLVTRKELRERLWPDSFVEFDRGIYTAMNRLRKALGDTVDSPRYIETRSRLGYRFVAPVSKGDVTARSELWAVPFDAKPRGKSGLTGFSAQGSAPFVATADPRFDGDTLRFQVQRPGGELAELILRLTTTKDGALNMRLDLCGAGSEEGRKVPGQGQVGPNSSHQSGHSESLLGRARR
ncbi:MAG TPA: winged helix-turn-helix domain-containing protein [Terriglobia bacterium]|nr:winged helix-turn-helix domain-containing protein [Terriglobia bacterium]